MPRYAPRFWIAAPSLAGLLLCATAFADNTLQPMAEKKNASPRLWLRLNPSKLVPLGKASVKKTQPTLQLSNTHSQAVSRRASARLAQAEALVRAAYAPDTSDPRRASLLTQAGQKYNEWDLEVHQLIKARKLSDPAYKEWARKTWEALLVQSHAAARNLRPSVDVAKAMSGDLSRATVEQMRDSLGKLSAPKLTDLINKTWQGLYGGARPDHEGDVLKSNPLLLLPRRAQGTARDAATVTYKPPANLFSAKTWFGRKQYNVRRDVAFVWVPGVARTRTEFEGQQRALLENGVLSLRADTGSWKNPFRNAFDVGAAINEARRITGNPSVKVVLVGYSQGNNSAYSFDQAKGRNPKEAAQFAELRRNVAMIYDLDSAARGTPMADLGVVLTKIFTGRSQEIEHIDERLHQLKQYLSLNKSAGKEKILNWLMANRKKIDANIKKITGRTSTSFLARSRARLADSIHDLLVGGLESLTTYRGRELMGSKDLARNLRHVPVLNTVGVVPVSRPDLVPTYGPLDQTPGWRFMQESLGLANDYQVPEKLQRLEPVLPGAVDLPTQAVGHWGITGIPMGKAHNAAHHRDFSPELHTYSMLEMVRRMGL